MHFSSAVVMAPTTPSMHADVKKRFPATLIDVNGPILLPEDVRRMVGEGDEEMGGPEVQNIAEEDAQFVEELVGPVQVAGEDGEGVEEGE